MATEADTLFHRLLRRGGQLIPLTSVCPSTTTTALSSLWTGRTPVEHGMPGTRLFVREWGLQANMIHLYDKDKEPQLPDLHGGLNAEERLVPDLTLRMDG